MCQFPLFETIAIRDGEIQHLAYHQQRVNLATEYFKTYQTLNLAEIIAIPNEFLTGLVRCKVEYGLSDYRVSFFHYQAKKIAYFTVVQVENMDYQFKYSNREIFNALPIMVNSEVILINNGFVSDCTIGNLLFAKNGQWFSPMHYLLKGTQLSRLLDEKQVTLRSILADEIREFEQVMLINAMNPFAVSRALPIQAVRF